MFIHQSTLSLPKKGEEVPLPRIKEICGHFGLHDLWAKIAKDPPLRLIYPACFLHDLKYWAGYPGEDVARLIADAELMIDVARLLEDTVMTEIMFRGVRVGGHEIFNRPFSWGFGRH